MTDRGKVTSFSYHSLAMPLAQADQDGCWLLFRFIGNDF